MKTCNECHQKCKGECCRFAPLPKKFINENIKYLQRPILGYLERNEVSGYAITKIDDYEFIDGKKIPKVNRNEQICPFLNSENKCAVYNKRPELCKMFGTQTNDDHPLTCHYHIGKDYSFPDDGTPEEAKINNEKYFKNMVSNKQFVIENFGEEMFEILNKS